MKRKLIGIILALALTLSLSGEAFAAAGEARQTGFFADVPRPQTDFADMERLGPDGVEQWGAVPAVELFKMFNLVTVMVDGALCDEFQRYVYTAEGETLEMLNEKFYELSEQYGVLGGGGDAAAHGVAGKVKSGCGN